MANQLIKDTCSLRNSEVRAVLDRLHYAAQRDKWRYLQLVPKILTARLSGKKLFDAMTPALAKDLYIPISREQGEYLYLTARAISAKRVIEFGTSFGVSTIYLAAAVHDNQGEIVIGTELEPTKHQHATANLASSGLSHIVDIRLGNALDTLQNIPEPIDLVLLDGWKDLYIPVLELLKPKLRKGAVVFADNIFTFKKALRPYVDYMQSGQNGFESMTLKMGGGMEYSYYLA